MPSPSVSCIDFRMRSIPEDYAAIEDSPPFRKAQRVGASVARCTSLEEYWRFLDPQEVRLLDQAKPGNVTFPLEYPGLRPDYRMGVGLQGYVREPESFTRTIRRMLLGMVCLPEPPLALKGTAGRPNERALRLPLPSERQEEIMRLLKPEDRAAVVQAAFARKQYGLMRIYKNSPHARAVLDDLQRHYALMMERITA